MDPIPAPSYNHMDVLPNPRDNCRLCGNHFYHTRTPPPVLEMPIPCTKQWSSLAPQGGFHAMGLVVVSVQVISTERRLQTHGTPSKHLLI